MEIQTERLILIPCTEEVIAALHTTEYSIGPHIMAYLEDLKKDPDLLGWGVWLVIDKESAIVIGDIGFKGKPNSQRTVEVGYGIIPSEQNKGYATEAVQKVIDWAFESDQVNRVVAECLTDNMPSIKVLKKLNMKRIGQKGNMLYWERKIE